MDEQIYKSMIAVMRDIEFIPKDKKNPQQGYSFRGIDDMYNAVHPLFKKHGIFVLSEVLAEKREERTTKNGGTLIWTILDIKFSFVAEDGSRVFSSMKGEAMDSGDKGSNKAMSAALKYAIMQSFMIPTAELKQYDTELETPEIVQEIDVDAIYEEISSAFRAAETAKDLTRFGVKYKNSFPLFDENLQKALKSIYAERMTMLTKTQEVSE